MLVSRYVLIIANLQLFSKIKHFDENGNKPTNQYTANKVLVNSKSEDISFGKGSGQGKASLHYFTTNSGQGSTDRFMGPWLKNLGRNSSLCQSKHQELSTNITRNIL